METLLWMGILGVAGFMTLFWAARKLYRKVRPTEGRDARLGPSRGQHIFAGVVAGTITYMVLSLIVNLLTDWLFWGRSPPLALTAAILNSGHCGGSSDISNSSSGVAPTRS